jgi:hypothetical protein
VVEEARVRETEVVEKARRRDFTAEYKLRVLGRQTAARSRVRWGR